MNDKKFNEMGQRLRQIRKVLDMSIADMAKGSGMTASTIARYEDGTYPPNLDYSKYLTDMHRVNLNFVYGTEENIFLENQEEEFDFGYNQEDVMEMLRVMTRSQHIRFLLLSHLYEYKIKYKWMMK